MGGKALAALVVGCSVFIGAASPALAVDQTRVTDPDKTFHRIIVKGSGNTGREIGNIGRDATDMARELTGPDREGDGSVLTVLEQPTDTEVLTEIAVIKAKPGLDGNDEITLYFTGHGNIDSFRLNASGLESGRLTAAELAGALTGLPTDVTLVVIFDSCFGGSFADDIGEDDFRKVIGTKTTCPFDLIAPFGWFYDTFTEDIEERIDDGGSISGETLKNYLIGEGWDLGVPGASDTKPKDGKSRCTCVMPAMGASRSVASPGETVSISGTDFSATGTVTLTLYSTSGGATSLGSDSLTGGSFSTSITVPGVPEGAYIIVADDGTYRDVVETFAVVPEQVPAASTVALSALAVGLVAAGAVVRRRVSPDTQV